MWKGDYNQKLQLYYRVSNKKIVLMQKLHKDEQMPWFHLISLQKQPQFWHFVCRRFLHAKVVSSKGVWCRFHRPTLSMQTFQMTTCLSKKI
jgi:hypothetical protein